jgi:hypothetical protein
VIKLIYFLATFLSLPILGYLSIRYTRNFSFSSIHAIGLLYWFCSSSLFFTPNTKPVDFAFLLGLGIISAVIFVSPQLFEKFMIPLLNKAFDSNIAKSCMNFLAKGFAAILLVLSPFLGIILWTSCAIITFGFIALVFIYIPKLSATAVILAFAVWDD